MRYFYDQQLPDHATGLDNLWTSIPWGPFSAKLVASQVFKKTGNYEGKSVEMQEAKEFTNTCSNSEKKRSSDFLILKIGMKFPIRELN